MLEHISAAFQIFGKYKLSVRENLIISSPEKREEDKIEEALKWADLDLKKEMVLGREFGGEELSGGQWQRIALARCYYRDREIVFVDEPTSAIDPLEELNIYQKLLELTKDKTVVVVTHRLGVAKNADKILVLEDGKLVETGTFEELQKMNGVFAKMWEEQAKWYRREGIENLGNNFCNYYIKMFPNSINT